MTLKTLKLSEYSDAADGFRAVSDMASAAKDRIELQITVAMKKANEGEAAHAADGQLRELAKNFHYTQVECGLVSTALDGFVYDLEAARKKLDAVVEEAHAKKFTVNSDGSVSYPPAGEKTDGKLPEGGTITSLAEDPTADAIGRYAANIDPNPNAQYAQEYADLIADAVKEATEADEKWAPKLRALKADDDLTVSDRDWADAKKDTAGVLKGAEDYLHSIKEPPKHGTPKENAEWWKSLTDEQRADYIAVHPDSIGWMDGLPATVRDEANRTVLAETRGATQIELDAWMAKEPDRFTTVHQLNPNTGEEVDVQVRDPEKENEWQKWEAKRKELQGRIDGMDSIQSRYDNFTGADGTRPYLLGFDNKNLGHAAVSIGNPDSADNVVTYVPGTGSNLGGIDGEIRRAEALQAKAERTDLTHSTASIVWLGYDAPQSLVPDATDDTTWADNARGPLSNFLTGLDTAHHGGHVNSTLLGHSYGSLVAGETMRDHPNLPVDNAILVGSPGTGVNHAKDLNIPTDHVWAATAKNDLVNMAPPPAGRLAPLNPKAYMQLFDDHSAMYGTDPTSNEFGGRTFGVPNGHLPGWHLKLMPAHSQYWEGDSLDHMAEIVTGGAP
ncbi:alpha/beta hydrolase family protein [Streptomyces sp. BK340]|uniref:alpha/beta hydrolase family protein n=1 Tax=Streptomyces sp. BK340 TaxID=2572903 RepID=UPI0021BD7DF4|nr:alpha/beta hydrolase family protein [Streptomyces sp. BK340]